MSLFDNGSGFVFLGGSFYSAGGDVIIQDSPQLVIGADEITGNLAPNQGPTRDLGGSTEGRMLSAPVHSNRTRAEAERFVPYGVS